MSTSKAKSTTITVTSFGKMFIPRGATNGQAESRSNIARCARITVALCALVFLSSPCLAAVNTTIEIASVLPDPSFAGGSVRFDYTVTNTGNEDHAFGVGCEIRLDGSLVATVGSRTTDSLHPMFPYFGAFEFDIPPHWDEDEYTVYMVVWSGTPGASDWLNSDSQKFTIKRHVIDAELEITSVTPNPVQLGNRMITSYYVYNTGTLDYTFGVGGEIWQNDVKKADLPTKSHTLKPGLINAYCGSTPFTIPQNWDQGPYVVKMSVWKGEVGSRDLLDEDSEPFCVGTCDTGYSASGVVSDATGVGIQGVRLEFSRVAGGGAVPGPTATDASGLWSQSGLQPGTTYRVTPTSEDAQSYIFSPTSRQFANAEAASGLDFQAVESTGESLVLNGNFELGNVGFTTGYRYGSDLYDGGDWPYGQGKLCVGKNPRDHHESGASFGDHTSGGGNMLIVNGSGTPDTTVWSQVLYIHPNTEYVFSYWLSSWATGHPADLECFINGKSLGVDVAPGETGSWRQVSYSWNSGNSTQADIRLVDNNFWAGGNDFCLDDISLATDVTQLPEIELTHFEINQCFQTVTHIDRQDYKLIETKPFVVRATLRTKTEGWLFADVHVAVFKSGTLDLLFAGQRRNVLITHQTTQPADIPFDWTWTKAMPAGDYDFVLTVLDKAGDPLLNWTHAETFYTSTLGRVTMYVVPIIAPLGTGEWRDEFLGFSEQVFPVPRRDAVVPDRFLPIVRKSAAKVYPLYGDTYQMLEALESILWLRTRASFECPEADIVCGILPQGSLDGADGWSDSSRAILIEEGCRTSVVLAHETGHCYGLQDEYVRTKLKKKDSTTPWEVKYPTTFGTVNPPPLEPSPDGRYVLNGVRYRPTPDDMHPSFVEKTEKNGEIYVTCAGNYILSGGYNVRKQSKIPADGADLFERPIGMMGNATPANAWVSGDEYGGLGAWKGEETASGALAITGMRALSSSVELCRVSVSGIINFVDGSAQLNPLEFVPFLELTPQSQQTQHQLVFESHFGDVLGSFAFELIGGDFTDDTYSAFAVVVDMPVETEIVKLTLAGQVIAEWRLTPHTPTIIVLSPNGGEQIADELIVVWSGSDSDVDDLYYTIQYSHNGGLHWSSLAFNQVGSDLAVDASDLPGGENCLIKVEVSDGWNRSEDIAGPFSVPTKAPKVTILSPEEDAVLARSKPVEGRCTAWDPETGYIEDPNTIAWSSNIDGFLGTGQSTLLNLSVGTHVIAVTAVDLEGKSGIQTTTITVVPPEPLVHWRFDEPNGTETADAQGRCPGVVHGAAPTEGVLGGAFEFDGANDYVRIERHDILAPQEMTLSFWMRPERFGTLVPVICKAPGIGFLRDYSVTLQSDGRVEFFFGDAAERHVRVKSDTPLTLGQWVHVAVARDGEQALLYLDGELDNSVPYSFIPIDKRLPLAIGAWSGAWSSSYFAGTIDDVRIYDEALLMHEIAWLAYYEDSVGQ